MNRTILFIPTEKRTTLTDEALAQNEIIFREKGLIVLAAPWNYAFCCKLDRLAGGGIHGARGYYMSDAAQYLHRYLLKSGKAQVQKTIVQTWFQDYSLRWTDNTAAVIPRLNESYRTTFRVTDDVIV